MQVVRVQCSFVLLHQPFGALGAPDKYKKSVSSIAPATGRTARTGRLFLLVGRLRLTSQPLRQSGLDRLASFRATQETPRLLRLDKSGFRYVIELRARGEKSGLCVVCAPRGQAHR